MTTDSTPLSPSRIWRELTTDERVALARALWDDADSAAHQAEAVQLIARHLHFRPQSVPGQPIEKRARQLAGLLQVSEGLASRALVVYHLGVQRPMLEAFLNHLGIAHQDGAIAESDVHAPAPAALREAASALAGQYPAAAVRLYLRTLAAQDPETWGALAGIVSELLPA